MSYTLEQHKRKKRLKKLRRLIIFLPIIPVLTLVFTELFFMPLFRQGASLKAKSTATYLISEAICRRMADEKLLYSDIVSFERNADGQINALTTDIVKINQLKAQLSMDIIENLNKDNRTQLRIPLGNLTHSSFLVGKGPSIPITFVPVGAATTEFKSDFSSAGINQTHHQIYIEVHVALSVLMPLRSVSEEVTTSVCVAESVIVGAVPEAFTNVQNIGNADDSISSDVVDFGAQTYWD